MIRFNMLIVILLFPLIGYGDEMYTSGGAISAPTWSSLAEGLPLWPYLEVQVPPPGGAIYFNKGGVYERRSSHSELEFCEIFADGRLDRLPLPPMWKLNVTNIELPVVSELRASDHTFEVTYIVDQNKGLNRVRCHHVLTPLLEDVILDGEDNVLKPDSAVRILSSMVSILARLFMLNEIDNQQDPYRVGPISGFKTLSFKNL